MEACPGRPENLLAGRQAASLSPGRSINRKVCTSAMQPYANIGPICLSSPSFLSAVLKKKSHSEVPSALNIFCNSLHRFALGMDCA